MARLEIRSFIRATPQRVWDVISDLDTQERWMVDVRELRILSEVRSGVGTVIDARTELFGLPLLHDVMEITGWEPPRQLLVRHGGQFTGTGAFELEPAHDGTIFFWWEEFQPPLGPLGELAFRLVVRPHMLRVFARSMDNARRLAESEPPA